MLSLSVLYLLLNKREWPSGLILAFAILIKPHFLILIPLLLFRKRLVAIASCISGIVLGLFIPSLYAGFSTNIQLLNQWKNAMLLHNISPVKGQDTIYSWLYRVTGSSIAQANEKIFVLSVLALIALLMLGLLLYHKRKEAEAAGNNGLVVNNFVFEYLVLVAIIPNLTVTDSEHFLFSVPLIAWLINYIFINKPGYLLITLTAIILLLYGGNLREAIGAPVSRWMTAQGILGLGNILLVGMSVYLMIINPSKSDKTKSIHT